MKVLFAGQSNADRLKNNSEALNQINAELFFSSFDGSALLKHNASNLTPDNYWVGVTTIGQHYNGPLMNYTLAYLAQTNPDCVIWIQGEQDSTRITNKSEMLEYKAALKFVFDQFLEYCQKIYTVTIGRRVNGNHGGIHLTRIATDLVAEEMRNIEIVRDNYDLSLEDSVHYSSTSQITLCAEISQALLTESAALGVKVISAKGYSRAVDVTFDNPIKDGIGLYSYKLFSIRDINGDLLQSPYSLERISDTKIRLYFSTLPQKQYLCTCVGELTNIDHDESMWILGLTDRLIRPAMVHIL